MTRIDMIHLDVSYGTSVWDLIKVLQRVGEIDENAYVSQCQKIVFGIKDEEDEQ